MYLFKYIIKDRIFALIESDSLSNAKTFVNEFINISTDYYLQKMTNLEVLEYFSFKLRDFHINSCEEPNKDLAVFLTLDWAKDFENIKDYSTIQKAFQHYIISNIMYYSSNFIFICNNGFDQRIEKKLQSTNPFKGIKIFSTKGKYKWGGGQISIDPIYLTKIINNGETIF